MKVILYIDDEPINLMLFEANFTGKFSILTGKSGEEGLELIQQHPEINILVSDMKMPGMNGVDFIRKAKNQKPELICYLLTGYEILPSIEEALNDGILHKYFPKPLDIVELENELNS
jgi:response regulator RpfG family c-di-GMP phosphodiesterase